MKHALKLLMIGGLALGLGACHRYEAAGAAGDGKSAQPMELRIYEVPQAQTESLRQALTSALAPGGQAAVTSPTPGKLLVYAPETSQDSIASALSGLASSSKDSHAPASLNLRFWIVDAVPGDGADDASLTVLTDVLKSWRGSMGAAHFKLVEATSGAVREGGQGEIVTGYQYGYETSVSNSGDISLQLQVRNNQNGGRVQGLGLFQGQLNVTPGHFVVLAQTPGPGGDATASGDTPVARLLVMRVDRSQQR